MELVEERRKGNMTERVMRATAASYVISPAALSAVAPDPDRSPDQLSALWLLALAARLVKEIGELIGRAKRARRPLATFAIDTEVRFASAPDRAAFAAELSDAVEGARVQVPRRIRRRRAQAPPDRGAAPEHHAAGIRARADPPPARPESTTTQES